jgi:hypothetical protein
MTNRNTTRDRKASDINLTRVRSAITNGSQLFHGDIDERGPVSRRFRDLIAAHEADLSGAEHLSEGQRSIVRRAAMLELQLELLESRFAENGGAASPRDLEAYQRCSNSLRRLLESLGLHQGRKSRDVTETVQEYVRRKYPQPAEAEAVS